MSKRCLLALLRSAFLPVLTGKDWENYLFVSALDHDCPENKMALDSRSPGHETVAKIWMERNHRIFNRKL